MERKRKRVGSLLSSSVPITPSRSRFPIRDDCGRVTETLLVDGWLQTNKKVEDLLYITSKETGEKTHESYKWNSVLYFKAKIEQKFTLSPNWKEAYQ